MILRPKELTLWPSLTGPAECLKKLWRQRLIFIVAADIEITNIPNVYPLFWVTTENFSSKKFIFEKKLCKFDFSFFPLIFTLFLYSKTWCQYKYIYHLWRLRKWKSNVWQTLLGWRLTAGLTKNIVRIFAILKWP